MRIALADAAATGALGRRLAAGMDRGVVYLRGELGAGKTALARAILNGRGYTGKVKSPTYTLVEPYSVDGQTIYHLDLYRLSDPEELEYAGGRDYFDDQAICLLEWPEKAQGCLPEPDIEIALRYEKQGRYAVLTAQTEKGREVLAKISY